MDVSILLTEKITFSCVVHATESMIIQTLKRLSECLAGDYKTANGFYMEISENELIAEFFAAKKHLSERGRMSYLLIGVPAGFDRSTWYEAGAARFHESWDWLMPVVEKIYSLGYFVHMIVDPMFTEPASCAIISSRKAEVINSVKRSTLIDAVYNSCIHFIRWYNSNQPKP